MTPNLRNIHRYTWFSLAILLPLGWLAAIWVIPETVWQTPIRADQAGPLAVLLQSRQSGNFVVNLRQDSAETRWQIEIFIKEPLTSPNTTVGVTGRQSILGSLGTRGIYRFDLDSQSARSKPLLLQFEDKIQGRTLRTIHFNNE